MPPFRDDLTSSAPELQNLRNKLSNGTINAGEAETFLRIGPPFTQVALVDQVNAWDALFRSISIPCDCSKIELPTPVDGFDRLIIVPEEITLPKIVTELERHMDVWVHPDLQDDLDATALQRRRDGPKSYAVWVRDDPEADREFIHDGMLTITLAERLLLGLLRIKQSNTQLDITGGTLCSGSRTSAGRIPYVEWSDEDCQLAISTRSETAPTTLIRPRQVIV